MFHIKLSYLFTYIYIYTYVYVYDDNWVFTGPLPSRRSYQIANEAQNIPNSSGKITRVAYLRGNWKVGVVNGCKWPFQVILGLIVVLPVEMAIARPFALA